LLLPYLDHGDLYARYRFDEPWNGPNNRQLAKNMPQIYAFHGHHRKDDPTAAYLAVVGTQTVWQSHSPVTGKEITDDPEGTVLLVENLGLGIPWMEPRDLGFDAMEWRIGSPRGVSGPYEDPAVATIAGRVIRLKPDLDREEFRAMLTIRGGESLRGQGALWDHLEDGRDRKPTGKTDALPPKDPEPR